MRTARNDGRGLIWKQKNEHGRMLRAVEPGGSRAGGPRVPPGDAAAPQFCLQHCLHGDKLFDCSMRTVWQTEDRGPRSYAKSHSAHRNTDSTQAN